MRQTSRAELKARLQKEGSWETYLSLREKFKTEGKTPSRARDAALGELARVAKRDANPWLRLIETLVWAELHLKCSVPAGEYFAAPPSARAADLLELARSDDEHRASFHHLVEVLRNPPDDPDEELDRLLEPGDAAAELVVTCLEIVFAHDGKRLRELQALGSA